MVLVGEAALLDLARDQGFEMRLDLFGQFGPWKHFERVHEVVGSLPELSIKTKERGNESGSADADCLGLQSMIGEGHVSADRGDTIAWNRIWVKADSSTRPTEARTVIKITAAQECTGFSFRVLEVLELDTILSPVDFQSYR